MEDTSLNEHSSAFEEMTVFEHVLHYEFYLELIFKLNNITLALTNLRNNKEATKNC